ncbi:hypothetical protein SAMN05421493_11410 [Pseudobutyrivibrio sp. 49]|uniref:restriction endonuclease subunit M n=1 Tax=Pseudobutyrivibrio sp. 49 TaxID=1855344 RepID=UPI00087E216E|nr:restriction endonuclease subunit M [Pseudobutyrivibrio sp. 49]SDI41951.1 hypothetical protein SAMN05421493_11410 [Pseudobutyrivibrio sp. 49]
MARLINFREYPIIICLKKMLKDNTTGRNIIFATDIYTGNPRDEITEEFILSNGTEYEICPRVEKDSNLQNDRTRKKAEVFTPSWICNKMNNHCDSEWFGRDNVFNVEDGESWKSVGGPIEFPKGRNWKDYILSKRLEITCGEAPYIASRYDAATGEIISLSNRIGILDRKIRIINENVHEEKEWLKWVFNAFKSVYGYEFQGDNLLIARVNLLLTFVDYLEDRWKRQPTDKELNELVKIIVWNFWQMDGITGTVPFGKPVEEFHQMTFFDYQQGINDTEPEQVDCVIYDWEKKEEVVYRKIQ